MTLDNAPPFVNRRMTRREFLQLASASTGTVLLAGSLAGCGGGSSAGGIQTVSAASGSGRPATPNAAQPPEAPPQQPPFLSSQPVLSQPPAQQPLPQQQQPTGTAALDFTLSSSISQTLAPFTLGQAFRQGEIPAGSAVVSTLPNFQAVIKNRWADGSAKFAILSGRATLVGGVPFVVALSKGTVSGGVNLTEQDLRDTGVTASIQFAPHGAVQLASLIGVASTYNSTARRWTAGRVREWISGSEMACLDLLFADRIGCALNGMARGKVMARRIRRGTALGGEWISQHAKPYQQGGRGLVFARWPNAILRGY